MEFVGSEVRRVGPKESLSLGFGLVSDKGEVRIRVILRVLMGARARLQLGCGVAGGFLQQAVGVWFE